MCRMLLLLSAILIAATVSARADDLDMIQSKKELRIGLINQPPYARYDPNKDAWSGANYDIGKLFADAAGAKLTVVESTWQSIIPALQAGKIDVGMAPFYATPRRALSVWFTVPARFDRGGILIRTADAGRFKTFADFDKPDVTFAVHVGSASEQDVRRLFPQAKIDDVSTDASLLEVQSGRANAWLSDMGTVSGAQSRNQEWATLWQPDVVFNSVPISFVIRPGQLNLQQFLNASIQFYGTQGTLSSLEKKWGLPPSLPPH